MLKIAVVAPIPSARQTMDAAVNPGDLPSIRIPYLRSCHRVRILYLSSDVLRHFWCRVYYRRVDGRLREEKERRDETAGRARLAVSKPKTGGPRSQPGEGLAQLGRAPVCCQVR